MEVNNLRTNRRAQIGNITIPLLKGEQGEQGEQGYSISRVERTSGDGTPGTTETYTIYINTTPETAIGVFYITNGGGGDMTKAIYDTNDSGTVDNAELVGGFSVGCDVPADAVFTDTVYDDTALKGRVSTLENAGYITKSVSDLANYYLKSETYTKAEVNALCDLIPKFSIEVVDELPTEDISTTTIYLVRDDGSSQDVYQEFIYVDDEWEILGGQRIDLSNYYQKSETYAKSEVYNKTETYSNSEVYTKTEVDNKGYITNSVSTLTNYYTKTEIDTMIGNIETLLASI